MTITADDVRRIATLAELDVADEEAEALARQLDRIVAHVAHLSVQDLGDVAPEPLRLGPASAPLRPDEVRPADLAGPVKGFGPDVRDGFFVVPRLSGPDGE